MEIIDLEKNNFDVIKKNNSLVESKGAMTLHQAQFVSFMISLVKIEDEDFKDYEMPLNNLLQIMNVERKNWKKLANTLRPLMQKVIVTQDDDEAISMCTLLSNFKIDNKNEYVTFRFDKDMKPLLLNLKSKFTQSSLKQILSFKSVYTIRFYEIIEKEIGKQKKYVSDIDKIGFSFDVEELKEIMVGDYNPKLDKVVYPKAYAKYYDFKRKVIFPAQEELKEKSKYYFEFEEKKLGRKVNKITFFVKYNENYQAEQTEDNKESRIANKNIDELKQERFQHGDFLMLERIRNEYLNKPFFRLYHMREIEGFDTYMPDMTLILKETDNKPLIINSYSQEVLKKDEVNAVIKYLNENPETLGDIEPKMGEYKGLWVNIKVNGKYTGENGETMQFRINDIAKDMVYFENEDYTFAVKIPSISDISEFVSAFFHNTYEVDVNKLKKKKDENQQIKIDSDDIKKSTKTKNELEYERIKEESRIRNKPIYEKYIENISKEADEMVKSILQGEITYDITKIKKIGMLLIETRNYGNGGSEIPVDLEFEVMALNSFQNLKNSIELELDMSDEIADEYKEKLRNVIARKNRGSLNKKNNDH
jgi:plasmid replication initiation protein